MSAERRPEPGAPMVKLLLEQVALLMGLTHGEHNLDAVFRDGSFVKLYVKSNHGVHGLRQFDPPEAAE